MDSGRVDVRDCMFQRCLFLIDGILFYGKFSMQVSGFFMHPDIPEHLYSTVPKCLASLLIHTIRED